VVVEDHGELVGALPERHQRPVIQRRAAVHEQQRVSVADDVDEQGHIPDLQARPLRQRSCPGTALVIFLVFTPVPASLSGVFAVMAASLFPGHPKLAAEHGHHFYALA
jgi:hypothetical protein